MAATETLQLYKKKKIENQYVECLKWTIVEDYQNTLKEPSFFCCSSQLKMQFLQFFLKNVKMQPNSKSFYAALRLDFQETIVTIYNTNK